VSELAKPSLHEIAAMPFPASMLAMRKHYNPVWGKHIEDGAEKATYEVRFEYSYKCEEVDYFEVEAFTEQEAEEMAQELLEKACSEVFEIDNTTIRVVTA